LLIFSKELMPRHLSGYYLGETNIQFTNNRSLGRFMVIYLIRNKFLNNKYLINQCRKIVDGFIGVSDLDDVAVG
jgi:hypothetical protein